MFKDRYFYAIWDKCINMLLDKLPLIFEFFLVSQLIDTFDCAKITKDKQKNFKVYESRARK